MSTASQPLAATSRPIPIPSHLRTDTTYDVPSDPEPEIAAPASASAPKKRKADTAAATITEPSTKKDATLAPPTLRLRRPKPRAGPSTVGLNMIVKIGARLRSSGLLFRLLVVEVRGDRQRAEAAP
jgi:hypothetical protein